MVVPSGAGATRVAGRDSRVGGRVFRPGVFFPGSEDPGLRNEDARVFELACTCNSIGSGGPACSCTRVAIAAHVFRESGSCHSAGRSPLNATTKYSPGGRFGTPKRPDV